MNADLGMMGQKVVNELGFVGREIIGNDVDLASEGLGGHDVGQKVDELALVWRWAVWPRISPLRVSRAA